MIKGRVAQIETMGLVDGPGIRIVIFLQGCSLRCLYCHNPEMWSSDGGTLYTPEELLEIILKYRNYFGETGGVTFSGGEPLFQSDFLLACLKLCKENKIHTCIETTGIGEKGSFDQILKYTDLVIFDIKALTNEEYFKITGGSRQISLLFLEMCQQYNIPLWIREVIVPNINDNDEHINKLQTFLKSLKNVERIELLPYQTLGTTKYHECGIKYRLEETKAMDSQKCLEWEAKLLQFIQK